MLSPTEPPTIPAFSQYHLSHLVCEPERVFRLTVIHRYPPTPSHTQTPSSGCSNLCDAQRTRNSLHGGSSSQLCWGHILSYTEVESPLLTSPPCPSSALGALTSGVSSPLGPAQALEDGRHGPPCALGPISPKFSPVLSAPHCSPALQPPLLHEL